MGQKLPDPEPRHAQDPLVVHDGGEPVPVFAHTPDPPDVLPLLDVGPELAHDRIRRGDLLIREHLPDLGGQLLRPLAEPHADALRVVLEAFEAGEALDVGAE